MLLSLRRICHDGKNCTSSLLKLSFLEGWLVFYQNSIFPLRSYLVWKLHIFFCDYYIAYFERLLNSSSFEAICVKKRGKPAAASTKTCQIILVFLHSFTAYEKLKHSLPLEREIQSLFTMSHTRCQSHQLLPETWFFFNDDTKKQYSDLKITKLKLCLYYLLLLWNEKPSMI